MDKNDLQLKYNTIKKKNDDAVTTKQDYLDQIAVIQTTIASTRAAYKTDIDGYNSQIADLKKLINDLDAATVYNTNELSLIDNLIDEEDAGEVASNIDITATFSKSADVTIPLEITSGNKVIKLSLGFGKSASDSFDKSVDEYASSAPVSGLFDAALIWSTDRYWTKTVKTDTKKSKIFGLYLQFSGSRPIDIGWDNTGLSSIGSFTMKDTVTGQILNIDMTKKTSTTLTNPALGN